MNKAELESNVTPVLDVIDKLTSKDKFTVLVAALFQIAIMESYIKAENRKAFMESFVGTIKRNLDQIFDMFVVGDLQ